MTIRKDIITFTGRYFDFTNIWSNEVEIPDIAKGLSNVCRFAGQCERFYSVAEHSILVADILQRADAPASVVFGGLMHDASEALLGDITSPLKSLLPGYVEIEAEVQRYLMDRLAPGAVFNEHGTRTADLIALAIEQRDIMHNTDAWGSLLGVYGCEAIDKFHIDEPMIPEIAYEQFLARYRECFINAGKETEQC
jgi:hypothetical protein